MRWSVVGVLVATTSVVLGLGPGPATAGPRAAAYRADPRSTAGAVGVTVGVVSFTEMDGLAPELHAGHHYPMRLMVLVSRGHEGSTATVSVQDGTVDGCAAVPLASGVATLLRCRVVLAPHPSGRPPAAAAMVTITVRLPDGTEQVKWYPHTLRRTSRGQG